MNLKNVGEYSGLKYRVEERDTHTELFLGGRIDRTVIVYLDQLFHTVRSSSQRVLVDLSETTAMDSAGVALLLSHFKEKQKNKAPLSVSSMSE
ncbi:STAS domain-containing protein, partial [candidate division CSSED10-310 bacterium]